MRKFGDILYRLLFTRDDDLDLLQIIFIGWVIYVSFAVAMVGSKTWSLPTAAWTTIMSVFATLAIAGTPIWIAKLLAKAPESPKDFTVEPEPPAKSFSDDDRIYYGVDTPPASER